MERVIIKNGTQWPNPSGEEFHDLSWRMIHDPNGITKIDLLNAVSVMEAYDNLIRHPAFTLKTVQEIVSGIRQATNVGKEPYLHHQNLLGE